MTHTIALLSGGLDSTVLVAHLLDQGHTVDAISVDYGQRHARELDAATAIADHYRIRHQLVDLTAVGRLLTGSALTDPTVAVPHGHYADESMRATVVPNRNAILLMVAVGVAATRNATAVATAVHAGDHPIYPDCRPEFITAADRCARAATAGYGDVTVTAPFVAMSKTGIAALGGRLGAPLHLSWSCYEGGAQHCGQCGTCVERRESFTDAGLTDPTTYRTVTA
ncbi:7-cyano-7-deazaguanine synthase QueC [Micromonospora sp. 15K316]|uniref:7-cyano-7-deazaguanine synthase QueC n=1 Tax=Micromonospora sp. 15K316 TaxID=2530376 RepID=UPI00104CFEB5|nr:7-cyano-7-deazaguanine synthase QueC [Micromonospora sp. 15K316]TDC28489.1 7-cyano-7-deazaguanine synthase QueC [Micromonospora sp. 15K316]